MDAVRARFVWHELMTKDPKAAAAFYTKVIGWKTQSWPNNPHYTLFTAGGQMMAGLMEIPAGAPMPPNWLSYVGVPSVDDTARQAESLGGRVVKAPEDIPSVGRFAVLQDPQGTTIAIFTPLPGAPPVSPGPPPVGDFSWHELITTDWSAALKFYHALFGWEATESMDMGPEMGTYQMYGWKGHTLGGMFNKPAQMPGPPVWLPYIKVKDAASAAAAVNRLGAKIVTGPTEVPGGDLIAQGFDPQGAFFAVHSAKPTAASKPAPARKARRAAKAKTKPAAKKKAKPTAKKKVKAAPKKKAVSRKNPAKKRTAKSRKR